jgi:hypothetical protein
MKTEKKTTSSLLEIVVKLNKTQQTQINILEAFNWWIEQSVKQRIYKVRLLTKVKVGWGAKEE